MNLVHFLHPPTTSAHCVAAALEDRGDAGGVEETRDEVGHRFAPSGTPSEEAVRVVVRLRLRQGVATVVPGSAPCGEFNQVVVVIVERLHVLGMSKPAKVIVGFAVGVMPRPRACSTRSRSQPRSQLAAAPSGAPVSGCTLPTRAGFDVGIEGEVDLADDAARCEPSSRSGGHEVAT